MKHPLSHPGAGRLTTAVFCALAALAACAGREIPVVPTLFPDSPAMTSSEPVIAPAAVSDPIFRETGTAGWYGGELHGKKTASGELFDKNGISAAHRTLPFGTIIRVTMLATGKSITARVNDRGPYSEHRILDLSYGAARELDFSSMGAATVALETTEAALAAAQFTVLAAVYTEAESARLLKERLETKFERVVVSSYETNYAMRYRVLVGSYSSLDRAERTADILSLDGLEPLILRKD
jgi:rare lipoprotein A